MGQCFVPDCRHQSQSHTCSFYRFPPANKDNDLRQKWIALIRRGDKEPNSSSRVCSCHFKDGNRTNLPELYKEREKDYISPIKSSSRRTKCLIAAAPKYTDPPTTRERCEVEEPVGNLLMSVDSLDDNMRPEQFEQEKSSSCGMVFDPDDGDVQTVFDSSLQFENNHQEFDSESKIAADLPVSQMPARKRGKFKMNLSDVKSEINNLATKAKSKENLKTCQPYMIQNRKHCKAKIYSRSSGKHLPQPGTSSILIPETRPASSPLISNTSHLELCSPSLITKTDSDSSGRKPGKNKVPCEQSNNLNPDPVPAEAGKFWCFPCNVDFPDFIKLREHFLRKHMFSKPVPQEHRCEICGKLFHRNQDLTEHRFLDHQLECDVCGMKFIKEVNLTYHRETAHSNKRMDYKCEVCNLDCKTYHRLYNHLSHHEEMKKFLCDICGKGFAFRGQLTAHASCHKDNSVQCDKCGKVFKQLQNFKKHQLSHAGITKPYTCEICGKGLATKESYAAHKLVHQGFPQFKCDLCSRGYYSHFNLRNHRKHKHKPNGEKSTG